MPWFVQRSYRPGIHDGKVRLVGPLFAIESGVIEETIQSKRVPGRVRAVGTAGPRRSMSAAARGCRRKFLRFFPNGFRDDTYLDWERGYKVAAHERWRELLSASAYRTLLDKRDYREIAKRAVSIESRTNLLFSFEKMALRDAVRSAHGARLFAEGLHEFLYGGASQQHAFDTWCSVLGRLPRRQTRVLTWPLATVFGFLAQPRRHIFLKPNVTRLAARAYGYEFEYVSRPGWTTYGSLLGFAGQIRRDQSDLRPIDMIDLQSFIWVQGSDEYEE